MDEDDLPLLEFQEILEIFEQWVRDGDVYSLEELRFGYMAMINPERKSEEFVLLPVWAAKGITRGSLNMPFYPQEDPESLAFMGFGNPTVCVVNAQTGEKYDFVNDDRGKPAVCYGSADLGEDSAIGKRRSRRKSRGAGFGQKTGQYFPSGQPVRPGPCIPET